MHTLPRWLLLVSVALAAGCQITPPPIVHQPMSVRPPAGPAPVANGSIYQASVGYRPLFEDRKARYVGDTLIVSIAEKTAANKKSETSVSKTGATSFNVPTLTGLPGKSFLNSSLDASSSNTFDGKGAATANNDFTGIITVTVIDVFPNGNLLVSGEKQIALTQGNEFIRFSGVVDPRFVGPANTVVSTQVADARIEYRANGIIDEAQVMGWLARFFLTFLAF